MKTTAKQRTQARRLLLSPKNKNLFVDNLPINDHMWDVIVDGLTEDERDCHVHVGKFVTMTLDYDKMALILIVDDGVRATRSTHKLIS